MRGQFGKVNAMHAHVLPWTDRPLVTRNLVGGEEGISDGGMSVSKLIPNPLVLPRSDGRGLRRALRRVPGSERSHVLLTRRAAGLSRSHRGNEHRSRHVVRIRTHGRSSPTRRGALIGVDATFRYRPLRRAIYRRFIARTELIWTRTGSMRHGRRVRHVRQRRVPVARRWFAGGGTTSRSARSTRAWRQGRRRRR